MPLRALAVAIALLAPAPQLVAQETITTEGIVDAPVAKVWAAWTTSAGLAAWLAPHADIDLRIGGLMRTQYDAKARLDGDTAIVNRVLSYDPERMLSIQVAKAPADFPFRAKVAEMWTVLYFSPVGADRTALRIVQSGFAADEDGRKTKAFFEQGNAYTLTQLQKHFAR